VDLVDEFSNYGASAWPKLKHLGMLINIPFKQVSEGNVVYEQYVRGDFKDIENYCYEDVVATYIIWLHLEYTRSNIKEIEFENLKSRALNKLREIQNISK
jgi:predicted PolB exonuclease-like 3'-5' exonuclease